MKSFTQFLCELNAWTKAKAHITRSFVGYHPRASSGVSQRQAAKEKAAREGAPSNEKVWETRGGKWAASCKGHDAAYEKEERRGPAALLGSKHIRYFPSKEAAEAYIREKCR